RRERWMRARLAEATARGERAAVLVGAFHAPALVGRADGENGEDAPPGQATAAQGGPAAVARHSEEYGEDAPHAPATGAQSIPAPVARHSEESEEDAPHAPATGAQGDPAPVARHGEEYGEDDASPAPATGAQVAPAVAGRPSEEEPSPEPASDVPAADPPAADIPVADTPATDLPAAGLPAADIPAADLPDSPALAVPDAGGRAPSVPAAGADTAAVGGGAGTGGWTTSLIPYTYALLDERSGYPAGIRDPEWQDMVLHAAGDPAALEEALTRAAVRICAELRDLGHPSGPADAREISRLAADLARLRGLPAAGRGELVEAVQTVLAQGEPYGRGRAVARAMERVLVGSRAGRPAPRAPRSGLAPAVEA
ncbi:DUF5682 family protein, partial [Streptomyces sp. SID8499]|uniref:DUF5682 family protein n=1 Tax=Streptomyces sp. SID8499 TaxID=2706106 RepID=UPI001EF2E6F4